MQADPLDISRTILHPLNDTKKTRVFLSRPVKNYSSILDTRSWQRREHLAQAFASDVHVGRLVMLVYSALLQKGCEQMAKLPRSSSRVLKRSAEH